MPCTYISICMKSTITTNTTSPFSVWIVSMVIGLPLSVDLVAVRECMVVCLCLDGSSSVFSAEIQLAYFFF